MSFTLPSVRKMSAAKFSAAVVMAVLLGLCSPQSSLAQNGAYYYAPENQLFVYTGNSGHEVIVGAAVGYVVVQIDGDNYPVYSSGSTLLKQEEVTWMVVDAGDGADTVDLSPVDDQFFPNIEFIDIFLEDDDDYVYGPYWDDTWIYGGDHVNGDTVEENGDYLYPLDDVEFKL